MGLVCSRSPRASPTSSLPFGGGTSIGRLLSASQCRNVDVPSNHVVSKMVSRVKGKGELNPLKVAGKSSRGDFMASWCAACVKVITIAAGGDKLHDIAARVLG